MSSVKKHSEAHGNEKVIGKEETKSPELLSGIPPHMKKGLDELRKYESQILEHINSSKEAASRFLSEPTSTLAELGIRIDPQVASSLKLLSCSAQNFLSERTYRLPDGKEIRPKINVTFVKHEK